MDSGAFYLFVFHHDLLGVNLSILPVFLFAHQLHLSSIPSLFPVFCQLLFSGEFGVPKYCVVRSLYGFDSCYTLSDSAPGFSMPENALGKIKPHLGMLTSQPFLKVRNQTASPPSLLVTFRTCCRCFMNHSLIFCLVAASFFSLSRSS